MAKTVSTLQYAKFYIEQGWHVFPLLPRGKTPATEHGFQDATIDLTQINDWIARFPNCNLGIATGNTSGFFVLDIDAVHGGEESFNAITTKYGQIPPTPISHTGGGGRHILFKTNGMDIRNTASKIGQGIDSRGQGGYIAAPNSIHPSGKPYAWDTTYAPSKVAISNPPAWVLDLLTEKKETPQIQTMTDGAYIAGQRNSALTSQAGAMRRRGMAEEAIFVALNVENLNKCVPPLSEKEVQMIAKSVTRYDPQAAPELQPRDRVTAEWAFAKVLFETPEYVPDHLSILPEFFSVRPLAEFWGEVLAGTGVALAAANCEILSDLENYHEWYLPRLDTYADTIKKYALRDRAAKLGWKLQRAAEQGDLCAVDHAVLEINQNITLQSSHRISSIVDTADAIEKKIHARAANPGDVWGIPYAWEHLSKITGGKQPGELTLLAGEPKIGKSWYALQDALHCAVEHQIPVFVWSGEMGAEQVTRRAYQLLGVNGENMRTGYMTPEDWGRLNDARALLLNSPLYIDDNQMRLHELKAVLQHEKAEHGIQHFVMDYAYLIDAPGRDEIEKTNNISRTLKTVCRELDLSGLLISSVNKVGMDTEKALKSNVRGSGQQLHDADVILFLTKFAPIKDDRVQLRYLPNQHDRIATLHISAGRELNHNLTGGVLHYSRLDNTPKFKEELQERKIMS
jgi:replicative DNA helicase